MPNLVKVDQASRRNDTDADRRGDTELKILPSKAQKSYLRRGLDQPGGKLPLFDENGREFNPRTIRSCIDHGWAEPWFSNPQKPDWQVCKLTPLGRVAAEDAPDGS